MDVEVFKRDGKTINKVVVTIGEKEFTLTENFGKLRVLGNGLISLHPSTGNVAEIDSEEDSLW